MRTGRARREGTDGFAGRGASKSSPVYRGKGFRLKDKGYETEGKGRDHGNP